MAGTAPICRTGQLGLLKFMLKQFSSDFCFTCPLCVKLNHITPVRGFGPRETHKGPWQRNWHLIDLTTNKVCEVPITYKAPSKGKAHKGRMSLPLGSLGRCAGMWPADGDEARCPLTDFL